MSDSAKDAYERLPDEAKCKIDAVFSKLNENWDAGRNTPGGRDALNSGAMLYEGDKKGFLDGIKKRLEEQGVTKGSEEYGILMDEARCTASTDYKAFIDRTYGNLPIHKRDCSTGPAVS